MNFGRNIPHLRRIVVVLAAATAACQTTSPMTSSPMPIGEEVAAPMGYATFCVRHPDQCRAGGGLSAMQGMPVDATVLSAVVPAGRAETSASRPAEETAADARKLPARPASRSAVRRPQQLKTSATNWALLETANNAINAALTSGSDQVVYGQVERWALPLREGPIRTADCEDYALEKQRALIQAGVAPEAMFLAVGTTRAGEAHAVLVVATDQGDYVLDNRHHIILPWSQAPYLWTKRQSQVNPFVWTSVRAPGTTQAG